MENKTCGECRFLESAKKIGVCEKQGMPLCPSELPSCSKFEQKVITNGDRVQQLSKTVFAKITTSPEMLAPNFIYHIDYGEAGGGYVSTIVKGLWHTESEAIAATVKKLKEVCDE